MSPISPNIPLPGPRPTPSAPALNTAKIFAIPKLSQDKGKVIDFSKGTHIKVHNTERFRRALYRQLKNEIFKDQSQIGQRYAVSDLIQNNITSSHSVYGNSLKKSLLQAKNRGDITTTQYNRILDKFNLKRFRAV